MRFFEVSEDKVSGFIRFQSPELAAKALEEFVAKPEAERSMAGTKAEWRVVEGSEEEDFYKRVGVRGMGRGRRGARKCSYTREDGGWVGGWMGGG